MKCLKLLIILILFLALFKVAIAEPTYTSEPKKPTDVQGLIRYYAKVYNTDASLLLKISKCESGYDPLETGDNGQAHQVFQYHQSTFLRHSRLLGEVLDYESTEDNIKLAAYIFANHPNMRNEWTTFMAIQNGGTYTFYSRLLHRSYTVTCI